MPEKEFLVVGTGLFATAWLGLLSLVFRGQNKKLDEVHDGLKNCKADKVPRPEYQAMKEDMSQRFNHIDEGIRDVQKTLKSIYSSRRNDK